jgi:thymidylate synthase (FAD)
VNFLSANRNEKAEIELLYYTPINIALYAGLICTDNTDKINNYDPKTFLSKIIENGHTSVLEHINYTFKISGVSRSLLQEQARHRHISLSVQSTRWAFKKYSKNAVLYKPSEEIDKLTDKQKIIINKLDNELDNILVLLNSAVNEGIPNDIVKYYIPECLNTEYVLTINARELLLLFELRTSSRALKEFRNLCRSIYDKIPEDHKFMFLKYFN